VNGVPQRDLYPPELQRTVVHSWLSTTTPGFKTLKRRNLPINNYSCSYTTQRILDGSVKVVGATPDSSYSYRGNLAVWYGDLIVFGLAKLRQPNLDAVVNAADSQVLQQISSLKFNAAQAFAERGQTTRMLTKSIARAVAVISALRKGNISGANALISQRVKDFRPPRKRKKIIKAPTHDEFSSLWLEYQYGWKPFLQDIYGAAELLAATVVANPPVRATGKSKLILRDAGLHTTSGLGLDWQWESETSVKVSIDFVMENDAIRALQQTGISNPALLAWELLPYSFVVDWFLPVGQFLENLAAPAGLRFGSGFRTVKSSFYVHSIVAKHANASLSPGGIAKEGASITREKIITFPLPGLPSFKNPVSLTHAANAVSLVSQLFSRR
jgi:hypothetical protein